MSKNLYDLAKYVNGELFKQTQFVLEI